MSVKKGKKVKASEMSDNSLESQPKAKKQKKSEAAEVKASKTKFEKPNNETKLKKDKKAGKLSEKIQQKKADLKAKKVELDPEKKAEIKEKKKKLKEERKKKDAKEGAYDIGVRAKQVWEEVRREDCPQSRKTQLLNELHALVKGNVSKIIYAHDTVRVIECLVALGDESIRDALFEEMKDDLMGMAKSKYASFFVQKMVKYGSKSQREMIFKALEGRVADLTKHKIANTLVETCYNDYCNASQRNRFLQEFFGPEFRHFKEPESRTVVQLMLKFPEKRRDILKHLASNVQPLISKGCYNHSLVHTVLYNYMIGLNHQIQAMPSEASRREKERSDFINSLRDVCVHIVHSHDGARLTMNAIWHGSAKDRKAIIKHFKTFMSKTAQDEHGYMALMAMLDAVDDTKMSSKAILNEILANEESISEALANERSRKVLIFALVGRCKTYFHPDVLNNLAGGDGNANSKKDAEVRRNEVAAALIDIICPYAEMNLDTFLNDNGLILVLGALLQTCNQEPGAQKLLEKLAKKVAQPFTPGDATNLIESPAVHMLTKKLMVKHETFFKSLLDNFDPETLKNVLACNRGAFLMVAMTELKHPDALKSVKKVLKNYVDFLKKQTGSKGAAILLQKIN